MLSPDLLEILVCPKSKQPLVYFPRGERNDQERDAFLFCPASGLRYRIDDGVPVMLVEEASQVAPEASAALVALAADLGLPVPA